jgi:hypothetical protein
MKKLKKTSQSRSAAKSARSFRAGVLIAVLLVIGVVTAIAKYESRSNDSQVREKQSTVANHAGKNYVTVEIGGKKLQVNAQALQQGPLTQEQAQQIADALKENKSTDGLVQVQNSDGSASIDLQGRFQNIVLAKKNGDGSVSQACVDNSDAAAAFLQSNDPTKQSESEPGRKVAVKEQ